MPISRVAAGRVILAALWIAAAFVLAVGAAGITATSNRPPVAGNRPELTWSTDRVLGPQLDKAAQDLAAISGRVDGLGSIGRDALVTLIDRKIDNVRDDVKAGASTIAEIEAATAALRQRLGAMPGIGLGDEIRVGYEMRQRYDRLVVALTATDGLPASWTALTTGSLAAIDLATSLADHDRYVLAAGTLGRDGAYDKALKDLAKAETALARSRVLRDRLAKTVDVSVLTAWIDRNAAFDAAVKRVWTLLRKSGGRVTPSIRDAIDVLHVAQDNLPPDARGLIVIMADVARGGLNQAVIDIEQARARLAAALEELGAADGQAPSSSPGPSPTPGPSSEPNNTSPTPSG